MADSIKLFHFFQQCDQIYGIHSNKREHSNNSTKLIFVISFAQIIFTTVAFLLFEAKSMFDYRFVFYALVSYGNGIAIYSIFIWQSENTLKFIENCERFIEKRCNSLVAYKDLIGKIELFNKILCYAVYISIGFLFILAAPYTFARYYISRMGGDSFYLFLPAWFPFDWKTPVGYLVAWFTQCVGAIAVGSNVAHFLNLVFGSCWLFTFIAQDITKDVATFNINAKTATSNENRTELTKCFCDMVQIYSDAEQCVSEFNRTIKYSLFVFFTWEMLGVSSFLVTIQFELWADETNLFEILLLILILNWMILFIFLLCEPGARITNQFEEFNDEFNRCDWHMVPIELQRMYGIFLLDTQNPIEVLSYANITSERETSKKIIRKIFSYFMTLRKFKI